MAKTILYIGSPVLYERPLDGSTRTQLLIEQQGREPRRLVWSQLTSGLERDAHRHITSCTVQVLAC